VGLWSRAPSWAVTAWRIAVHRPKFRWKKSPTSVYDDDDIKIRCKATGEEQTTPAARVPKPYSKTEKLQRRLPEQAYYLVIRTKTISYLNAALQAR
jgi:hypothetical protein